MNSNDESTTTLGAPVETAAEHRARMIAEHTAYRKRTGDSRTFATDLPPDQRKRAYLASAASMLAEMRAWGYEAQRAGDFRGTRLAASGIREGRREVKRLAHEVASLTRRVTVAPQSRSRERRSSRRTRSSGSSRSSDDPSGEPDPPLGGALPRDLIDPGKAALA